MVPMSMVREVDGEFDQEAREWECAGAYVVSAGCESLTFMDVVTFVYSVTEGKDALAQTFGKPGPSETEVI